MLLINVHQLDIIFAQTVRLAALEDQVDDVRRIFSLECENIFVLCGSEDFGQGVEVDAQGNVAVASVGREHLCFEHHGNKGDMRVVHGLEGHARVIAVEIAILDEVFDRIDNLDGVRTHLSTKDARQTFFKADACSSRASNTAKVRYRRCTMTWESPLTLAGLASVSKSDDFTEQVKNAWSKELGRVLNSNCEPIVRT